jgi:hypothetical protein
MTLPPAEALAGRGLHARILEGGTLQLGDAVRVEAG